MPPRTSPTRCARPNGARASASTTPASSSPCSTRTASSATAARRRPRKVDLCGDETDFFNVCYEVLARGRKRAGEAEWDSPYVNWIPTYNGMEQNILEVTPKAWGSPRSRLADILLGGHPDTNGAPRLKLEPRGDPPRAGLD